MRKYGLVQVSEDPNALLFCMWEENIITKLKGSLTNAAYNIPVTEIVTGEKIKALPSAFDDLARATNPRGLTYIDDPIEISKEEMTESLNILKSNKRTLNDYLSFIEEMKAQAEEDYFESYKGIKPVTRYGFVEVSRDLNRQLLCTWTETFIDRLKDGICDSHYVKPVKEMMSGTIIKPEPFVFQGKLDNLRGLAFVSYPEVITKRRAIEFMEKLRSSPEELKTYLKFIEEMKAQASGRYKEEHSKQKEIQ